MDSNTPFTNGTGQATTKSRRSQSSEPPPTIKTLNAPSSEFWEDDLEVPLDQIQDRIAGNGCQQQWIASRTGRQLAVLCRALGVTDATRIKDQRTALAKCNGQLIPFLLTDHFAHRKGSFAIADFAVTVLPDDVIDLCRCKDGETYDTKALLYAMLHADPGHLKTLFHLDKIHKSGFARMSLQQKTRQPTTSFEEFLTLKQAQETLAAFDKQKRDRRQSHLKNIIRHHDHHLVFIRRPERPQCILREGRIRHGHRAEWIILDFADNARRVNISSNSNEVPLQIANALASAYFRKDVEYDNECEVTFAKQILNLLDHLKAGTCDGLRLADLDVRSSPVHGVDLRLHHDNPDIVQRSIAAIERDYSSLTDQIDRIANVKVLYAEKRIEVKFEKLEGQDEYVVRYTDHRLNAALRRRFEDFMRDMHAIPILSTEKRFARRA